MINEIWPFFEEKPWGLPLFEAVYEAMEKELGPFTLRVGKTQIGFRTRYGFAWFWFPIVKMKNFPEHGALLSFGLDRQVESPRIAQAVMPKKNRWTHHIILESEGQLDEELMGWLRLAYDFSQR